MWEHEEVIDIAAGIEIVYAYLSDFTRHPEWSSGVVVMEQLTTGTPAVGTEFKASEIVPVKITSFCTITLLEPPTRIGWESTDHRVFRTQWAFELTAREGGAHVMQRVRFEPVSFLGRLLLLMRKQQVPKENQQSLQRIKEILEGKAQPKTA
jgi:uncharacterized membrane protein